MYKKIFIFILISFLCVVGVGYFLIYTQNGSKIIVQNVLSSHIPSEDFSFKQMQGNLVNGLSLDNVVLENLRNCPEGTKLKIQKLDVELKSFSLNGLFVNLVNARLNFPDVDPIIASGDLTDGVLNFNIFSNALSINQIKELLPNNQLLSRVSGSVNNVDLFIKGTISRPEVTGEFLIEKANYDSFRLENTPVQLDIHISDIAQDVKLVGTVNLKSGLIYSKRTQVKILKGIVRFAGNPQVPSFDFKGESRIDKTEIDITLKGDLKKPDLQLSSDPAYSKEKLMVMLATGQSWKGFEQLANNQVVSSVDITKDFLNYFVFSGHKSNFAQKFGLQDFTLKFEKDKRMVGASKELTGNLKVGYGVEQEIKENEDSVFTQKVTGEYQVNKKVSVGVEKELKERDNTIGETNKLDVPDDKVFMKFKTKF